MVVARSRIGLVLAISSVIVAAFAAVVITVAVMMILFNERSRNVHEEGALLAVGAWAISPYAMVAWSAWAFKQMAVRSALWFVLSILIAAPMVLTLMSVVATRGRTDAQMGLGLMIFPFFQWLAVGIVSLVAMFEGHK